MQTLVDKVRSDLMSFVEQRDDLLLVCPCRDQDVAITLQILRDVDESSGTDLFLFFSHEFRDASSWVSAAAKQLETEHRLASDQANAEGRPEIPPLPGELFDDKHPATERLVSLINYGRDQIPTDGGHRLVWVMMPLFVLDAAAWRALWSSLLPGREVLPWMRRLRIILRESPDWLAPQPKLATWPRVRYAKPDFGPAALSSTLEEEAADESASALRRMQALLQVACLDYAHGRERQALERYQVVLSFYEKSDDLPMQAFVLNCIGDVFHRRRDYAQAQDWYQRAVKPIVKSPSLVIFATIVKNLADVAYAQREYSHAEQYYDGWEKLAAKLFDVDGMVRAEEWRGRSQEQQGAWERATASWQAAVHLSRTVGLAPYLKQNLRHLERAYQQQQRYAELAQVRQELSHL